MTFAVLGGYMDTSLFVSIAGRHGWMEIANQMYSELVQKLCRVGYLGGASEPSEAIKWRIVLQVRKQTDVCASAIECVDRWVWYKDAVMDGAPSFSIRYIYKNGAVFQWGGFE